MDDPRELPIGCDCGALRGALVGASARRGNRVVCYCDDCQAYAHHLGCAARALDAYGGTEVFQTSPANVVLRDGLSHLACLQLRPAGLLRWYASCCRSPLGNTLARPGVPFVGLVVRTLAAPAGGAGPDAAGAPALAPDVDAALGPVRGAIFGKFARGGAPLRDARARPPLGLVARSVALLAAARLRGDHVRSPFFDAGRGAPVVAPCVLHPDELAAAEAAARRAPIRS
ncbi:MAG: DUF6151 family protein [Myxococcota bacterium]